VFCCANDGPLLWQAEGALSTARIFVSRTSFATTDEGLDVRMDASKFVQLRRRKQALLRRWRIARRPGEGDAAAVSRTGLAGNWPEDRLRNAQRVIADLNRSIEEELGVATTGWQRGSNLETMNKWLRGLRREEQRSLSSARKAVFINIFDLIDENYGQEQLSRKKLAAYTRVTGKYFPLQSAKSQDVKVFLQRLLWHKHV
jgi:hypothetical protein